jgi:cation diffusion facilitator family transporter
MSPDPRAARPDLLDLPPPPPASGGALAWLRWTITMVRAGRGRNRLAIRRHHAPTGGTESLGTVAIALGADLAMVLAKAVAALLTGSAALFAETLHSLADSGNQLLLLKGLRGSRRRPDAGHPFGYGAELFYWSLLAALGVFVIGGVLSVWEGIQHLLHPGEVQVTLLGVAVLVLGCLLDGTSWLSSVRQLRREARVRGVRFRRHLRSTTDTAVTAVFYEDAAALVGNVIALAGLGLHQLLGSPAPDAVAGIAIGLLLAAIGLRLAARNRALLTNRSDSRWCWTASGTCSPPTRRWPRSGRWRACTWGPTSCWSWPRSSRWTRSPACGCVSSWPSSAGAWPRRSPGPSRSS